MMRKDRQKYNRYPYKWNAFLWTLVDKSFSPVHQIAKAKAGEKRTVGGACYRNWKPQSGI